MAAPVQPQPATATSAYARPRRDPNQDPNQPQRPQGGWQQRYAPANVSAPSGQPAPVPGQPTGQPAQPPAPPPPAPSPVSGVSAQPVTASAPPAPPPVAAAAASPVQDAQNVALASLNNAANAPDRVALANTTFQNLVKSGDPAYQQTVREAAANAARYGRIGAGQTTNELDDLALARQRTLDTTASQLSTDAAGQTLSDRLAVAQAGLGQYQAYQGTTDKANQLALDTELGRGNLVVAGKNADTNATGVANQFTLGNRTADTAAAAQASEAAYQTGQLGLGQGRLGLDTTTAQNADRINQARLALDTTGQAGDLAVRNKSADATIVQNQGDLAYRNAALAQSGGQFDKTFGEQQLVDDRNYSNTDQFASALAALSGKDLTSSGVDANGNPINATNPGAVAGSTPSTAGPSFTPQVIADTDPQVSQTINAYKAMEATIGRSGYASPQGQLALSAEQQARAALQAYLAQNNATLSPAQRAALGIEDNTPGFEQASTTAKFAPVGG